MTVYLSSGTMRLRRLSHNNIFGLAVLLLTAAIAIAWQCSTPVHSDDYPYQRMADAEDDEVFWDYQGQPITQFAQVPEAAFNHWRTVNGRGSNMAYTAVQPLPLWLIKLSCGAMIAALALLIVRAAGLRRKIPGNPVAMTVVIFLLWFGLRWSEQMQSSDFVYNYVAPSVLMLGVLVLFFDRNKRPGPWAWVLAVVFAVWHETFTITFGVFVGVQWLMTRRHNLLVLLAILVAGALMQYSPGTSARMDYLDSINATNKYPLTSILASFWLTWLTLGWFLLRRPKLSGTQRRDIDTFVLGLTGAATAAIIIMTLTGAPMRAHWGIDVLAIVLCGRMAATYRVIRIAWYIKVTAFCLYAAWGVSLVYWQLRTTRFTQYLADQIHNGNNVIADLDGILDRDVPFWLMNMTTLQYGGNASNVHTLFAFYNSDRDLSNYLIVQPQYAGQPFDRWPKVPGLNDLRFAAGNVLVRKGNDALLQGQNVEVEFGDAGIAVSPAARLLSLISGKTRATIRIDKEYPLIYMGDTLQVVFPDKFPRLMLGRAIRRVDYPDNLAENN